MASENFSFDVVRLVVEAYCFGLDETHVVVRGVGNVVLIDNVMLNYETSKSRSDPEDG